MTIAQTDPVCSQKPFTAAVLTLNDSYVGTTPSMYDHVVKSLHDLVAVKEEGDLCSSFKAEVRKSGKVIAVSEDPEDIRLVQKYFAMDMRISSIQVRSWNQGLGIAN